MSACYRRNPTNLAMMRNLPAAAKQIRSSIGGGFIDPGVCSTPIGAGAPHQAQDIQQSCDSWTCYPHGPTRQRRRQMAWLPMRSGQPCAPGPYAGAQRRAQPRPYAGHPLGQSCAGAGRCGGTCAKGQICGCYDCRKHAYGWASKYWGYGYNQRRVGCRASGGCTGSCITPGF